MTWGQGYVFSASSCPRNMHTMILAHGKELQSAKSQKIEDMVTAMGYTFDRRKSG
jgi:hypothetical protein